MLRKILVLFLFLFLSTSYAQLNEAIDIGSDIEGVGPRALSLGGAFTAVSDDYSAMFWNPAGLAQMKRIELEMSLHYLNLQITTDYAGSENTESAENFKISSLALIYPYPVFRGSLVFGFGFQRVKNYDRGTIYAAFDTTQNSFPVEYQYADGSPVNPFYMTDVHRSEQIDESGSMKKWTATAALDLTSSISFGMSINLYTGDYSYKNSFSQIDVLNKYQSIALGQDVDEVNGIRDFQYDFYGFELGVGFLFDLSRNWRIAGRIDLPLSFYVTEKYSEVNSIYFDDPADEPILNYPVYDGEDEYSFKYPLKFSIGSSFLLNNLLISGQLDYRDWAELEIENNNQTEDNTISELSKEIDIRLGFEYIFPAVGFAIAGGMHSHISPTYQNEDTQIINSYSLGLAYIFSKSMAVNIGANMREFEDQSAGDDIMPQTAERSYTYFDFRVGMKYHY